MAGGALSWRGVYGALLVLRLLLALGTTGYVHPDEWFQSGEAVAGPWLNIDALRTWEFDPANPARSLASICLFALPLRLFVAVCQAAGASPSARWLFAVQRLTSFGLTLILDYSVAKLVPASARQRSQTYKTLCLFSTSSAVVGLANRPFSNTVEAATLGLVLVVTQSLVRTAKSWQRQESSSIEARPEWTRHATVFGLLAALGTFSRFTFPVFLLAPSVVLLQQAWHLAARHRAGRARAMAFVGLGFDVLSPFVLLSLLHTAVDSYLYHGVAFSGVPVLAPLNALLYNLRTENLAQHGEHPRYLHLLVNAPMVLGLAPWLLAGVRSFQWVKNRPRERRRRSKGKARQKSDEEEVQHTMRRVYVWCLVVALLLLSLQPHQEPRFLLPLLLPATLLFASALSAPRVGRRTRRVLLGMHVLQHVLLVCFYSLHQCALLPTLFHLNGLLRSSAPPAALAVSPHSFPLRTELHVWRTFMPPRHLVLPPRNADVWARASVQDHGSLDVAQLAKLLLAAPRSSKAPAVPRTLEPPSSELLRLLIAPVWALPPLEAELRRRDARTDVLYVSPPQLDMDHLPEVVELWPLLGLQAAALRVLRIESSNVAS